LKKETKKIAHKPNPSNAQYVILIHTPPTLENISSEKKETRTHNSNTNTTMRQEVEIKNLGNNQLLQLTHVIHLRG
jgi:hypothetical protein